MHLNERRELVARMNRVRDLCRVTRDPVHRKTLADLIAYLEGKLTSMDGQVQSTGHTATV